MNSYVQKITLKSLEDIDRYASKDSSLQKKISVDDKVVRGPKWEFGDEDGGIGSIGVVKKVTSWKGSGTAVLVEWANGFEALYKFQASSPDTHVTLFESSNKESESDMLGSNGTWTTKLNKFLIKICRTDGESNETLERKLSFYIVPCMALNFCLSSQKYETYRQRLESIYIPNSRNALSALAKYVNDVVRTKDLSRDDILGKKWTELIPSAQDLTRSAALKVNKYDFKIKNSC